MATLSDKALCLFTFETLGLATAALNHLSQAEELEIIELVSRGEFASLIFFCSKEGLKNLQPQILALNYQEELILEAPHPALIKTYLNLTNHKLEEAMVIFESKSFKTAFETLQLLLFKNWKALEFRFSRSGTAQGYVLMTGPIDSLEKEFLAHLTSKGSLQVIESPSPTLRQHFDL